LLQFIVWNLNTTIRSLFPFIVSHKNESGLRSGLTASLVFGISQML